MTTKIDDQISLDLCRKVSKELEAFCVELFKKNNLVRGKSILKYGDGFQFKMEAFSNDEITKELSSMLQNSIGSFAKQVFALNGLELDKNIAKYGSGFQITIKADKMVIGDNGVNLASKYAKDFRVLQFVHNLPAETLGKKAIIGGQTVYLAGVQSKRGGDLVPVVLTSQGKIAVYKSPEVLNKFWGNGVAQGVK